MSGTLHLTRTILHAVQTHAHDAAPDECVGLLFGRGTQVTRPVKLTNRAPSPRTRFFADPQELIVALSEADARGETLLAVYHSHPDGAAFPSPTDVAAAQYDAALLIVTPTEVGAFRLEGEHISAVTLVVTPCPKHWSGSAPETLLSCDEAIGCFAGRCEARPRAKRRASDINTGCSDTSGTTRPHDPVPYPRAMFSKPQLDRYSRQLILPGVGAVGQQRLLEAKVLVVGAGGLGSPVLLYLAAAGVGTLGVVDDDVVELSNLQRQIVHGGGALGRSKVTSAAARLGDLNPEVRVELFETRLRAENAPQLLAPYDLIVDGSDTLPTRYLLSDACVLLGKPLLYGAMSQFEGQLSLLHAPTAESRGPCYRCVYPEPPPAGTILSCAEGGVFGALPGVIGSLMAVEVIKHLVGLGEASAKLTHYDALSGDFRTVKLRRNPACPSCGEHPSIRSLEGTDYGAFCGVS